MKRFAKSTLVAGGLVLLAACHATEPPRERPVLDPVSVQVSETVTAADAGLEAARVVPVQEADVATRTAGVVARMAVQVGDRVPAGGLLARLDAADVDARIAGAEARAELAARTFARIENLARDGAASQQELDEARAALASAQAGVEEAGAQGAYVEIRAPFAGVVTARMADAGDLASPGQPLLRLASEAVKVMAELPASRVGEVEVGDAVTLSTDSGVIEGVVRRVVPALDGASRRFAVEVEPTSREGLMSGAFVRLGLEGGGGSTRWVPLDALVRNGQLTGVFAVEGDTLRLRWVRLGSTRGDAAELLSGPPGELTVVRTPSRQLRDGQPVERATPMPWTPAGVGGSLPVSMSETPASSAVAEGA